jgi:hypothetical protein
VFNVPVKQFNYEYSFRRLTLREKRRKSEVLNYLISVLQNREIRFRGVKLPFILSPELSISGWQQSDLIRFEKDILRDAEYLRDVEVLQDVPQVLFSNLKKLEKEYLMFETPIAAIPGAILNALVCAALRERFSEDDLRLCGIFVKVRDFGIDGEICDAFRIDVDKHIARRGFFVSIIKNGLTDGLQVFRHPTDERPFRLRARFDFIDYTAGENE